MGEIVPLRPDIIIPTELRGVENIGIQEKVLTEVGKIVVGNTYDSETLSRIERELLSLSLTLPATRSPDIKILFDIIEQICGATDIETIYSFLENTYQNNSQARNDLQRCGAILQKIAGIRSDTINWGLIFSRLEIKKEAA